MQQTVMLGEMTRVCNSVSGEVRKVDLGEYEANVNIWVLGQPELQNETLSQKPTDDDNNNNKK